MSNNIRGAGGQQSSSRTPIEAPDSLKSSAFARILDLISEGEIKGLVNGLQSVFLDETPVANADGSLNFASVQVETRNGTQDQPYMKGFPSVESETAVGVELVFDTPWVQSLTNTALSAVSVRLGVSALSSTNTSNGDISGYTVGYAIDLAVDGGPFVEKLAGAFTGKTSSGYERGHRIDLPDATTGWTLRVRRLTPQATTATVQDRTTVQSYTQIIDAKLRYPNCALAGVAVDAEQFRSIPSRAYDCEGMILLVPSNYDAELRTYDGVWDGLFQPAYSNNPAWAYYTLVLSDRFGLGHLVDASQVDKWELYKIAQYCDELVDDGKGGLEPRFTCNVYLQQDADAYRVLQDLATVFRGISYWASGQVRVVADKPEDPVYCYNNSNVIDGKFVYQGSGLRTRYTVAQVSWNDLTDFGRAKIEYIPDEEGIAKYGIRETSVVAFGCTSQGQAWRVGQWILITSRYETQSVSFSVGIDGTIAAPGQIIEVADKHRAGKRIGGRLYSGDVDHVVVDDLHPDVDVGHFITCIMPDGKSAKRTISAIIGKRVEVSVAFDSAPVAQSPWITQSDGLNAQRFRVIGVTENDNLTFSLSCLQHNESKFDAIENGTAITVPVITELPNKVQLPPTGIVITHRFVAAISGVATIVSADWEPTPGAVGYEVGYRMNNGPWVNVVNINDSVVDIPNALAGIIDIRVNAVNSEGKRSVPVVAPSYDVPEAPSSLDLPPITLVDAGGGEVIVDCAYDYFRLTLDFNVTTFTFINVPTVKVIIIEIEQTGTFTVTMPPSVSPVSGLPYVATAVAGALDVLGFNTTDMGVRWALITQQPVTTGGALVIASISPTSDSDVTAEPATPAVTLTGSASGGTGPYTHAWTRADSGGADFLCSNPAIAAPTFSIAPGTSAYPSTTQTWRYTATDTLGASASATAAITLERTAAAGGLLDYFDSEVASKSSFAFRPSTATSTVSFTMYRNGTWSTNNSSPATTIDSNDWISSPVFNSGDLYNVKFSPVLAFGTAGSITNGAATMQPLTSDRTIQLVRSKLGSTPAGLVSSHYSVLVEVEEAANPGVIVLSGQVELIADAETSD